MKGFFFLFPFLFLHLISMESAFAFRAANIKTLQWDGLEVVWLEDTRFPTYNVTFYFADGPLSDSQSLQGTTNAMFAMLTSGTRRFNQKEISDNLEFFGASQGASVVHEFSTFTISGLIKDIAPTMKLVCHLFKDSTFPKEEVRKEKRRAINSLRNLVTSHGSLASRAFREISLRETPFFYPVSGKIKDIKKMKQSRLREKLLYFNKKVKKRIYLSGPKEVLLIQKIVNDECAWRGQGTFVRQTPAPTTSTPPSSAPAIYLVAIPQANQAQVRLGRFLSKGEFTNAPLLALSSGFLGGGFSSPLMQEVRVKRGLTYSISAFAAGQKDYGRAQISTFTKNSSLEELLNVIKQTVEGVAKGEFASEALERARGHISGGHPFRFEKNDAYLNELIFLDHTGKDYEDFYNFQHLISKIKKSEVALNINSLFQWNKQTIVVLGPKNLAKRLRKFGQVKVLSYKKFL